MNHTVGAARAATAASRGSRRSHMGGFLLVWAAAFLGSWLLWTNPGYFSHDELQWAWFAGAAGPIPWVSWLDVSAFQYRPLTFNLWLWLSRQLFDAPQAFHAVVVAWGATNAALLWLLARRVGVAAWPAVFGALLFALGPYATAVHGWVATIGDLAWVACALLVGLLVTSRAQTWVVVAGTALLTAVALLAKEAAVAIPALLAVAWLLMSAGAHLGATGSSDDAGRAQVRSYKWATIASALVVAGYLALRLGVLLETPDGAASYRLDFAHAPRHWLEYQLFAFLPNVLEVFNVLARGLRGSVLLAGVLWLGVAAACWRAHWRLAALFLLGGIAALAPVLPLAGAFDQYGYGFAALATMTAAAAWPHARHWGRAALALAAVACLWHGVNVMLALRHVGEVQAVFSPALADAVQARGDRPLRLHVAADAEPWIFQRLTHDIPGYRGTPLGSRVLLVPADAVADAEIGADGRLRFEASAP